MGFKRLSKGKPFASPPNKRKAADANAPDQAAEKSISITPAKAEEDAPAKLATSHAVKRRLLIEGDKTPEENDDMNNAAGALHSSASPTSGSDGGPPLAPPCTAGGTTPSSVSTAAVGDPPAKKLCIDSSDAIAGNTDITLDNPEVVPLAALPPHTKAGFSPALLPFFRCTGLAPHALIPATFPFSNLQQQQPLRLLPQQQQQHASPPLSIPLAIPPAPSPSPSPAPSPSPSPVIELSPVQHAVLDHANATETDPGTVWTSARHIAVKYTAMQLLKAFAAPVPDISSFASLSSLSPAAPAKVTAGVSYVVRSESKQIQVTEQEILPHMVYRPPAPPPGAEFLQGTSPEVAAALEILLHQKTLAVSMPLKDENTMKTYLLEHTERAALLDEAEGTIMELEGASNVAPLCQEKIFMCLHYEIVQNEINDSERRHNVDSSIEKSRHTIKLVPCLPSSTSSEPISMDTETATITTEGNTISSSTAAPSLASSNVQLGIMIRKGVGGTYPLRSAARKLHAQGLLGALMDENLPTAATTTTSTVDNEETGKVQEGIANGTHFSEPPLSNPATEAPSEGPVPAHQRLHLYTLSCRLELYIDEKTWESLDSHSRLVLQSTIYHLEHRLRAHFEKRNWEMLKGTVREKLETLVATSGTGLNEEDKKSSPDNIAHTESKDVLDSALAAKLLPLFSLPEIATNSMVPHSSSSSSPVLGKDNLMMDFSLALVLAASCLSTESHAQHHMPWPLYCINTRDCFTHHLVPITTIMHAPEGRTFTKTEWFFKAGQLPVDYYAVIQRCALTKTGESTGNARKCDFAAALSSGNSTEIAKILAKMMDIVEKQEESSESNLLKTPSSTPASLSPSIPNTDISTIISPRTTASGVLFPVGVTTYNNVYEPAQLSDIERRCDSIDTAAREGRLPATCSHSTFNKGGGLKRTKFFFGARYLWTKEQLAAPDAHIAKGVRVDVPPAPKWVHAVVESPLVAATVLPEGHINSVALNMYHDGSEGIQVHYDDSARFQQPIFSVRLFSDSRLSFGTQLYGYTNGSFFIPMPRGCVTAMESGSYAANGVKHCVRPVDMNGKSAGMILRRMNPTALAGAREHFMEESIDWMRGLSLNASLRADSILGQGLAELAFGHGSNNISHHHHHHRGAGVRTRGLPGSKTMRQVANMMEYMIRSVEYTDWRERTREATIASVMARMVRRVEVAEKSGIHLVEKDDNSVFGVVDSMVSCCEILSAPSVETEKKALYRKRKFWPPRPSFTGNLHGAPNGGKGSRGPYRKRLRVVDYNEYSGRSNAGSTFVLPDAVVVAQTMNRMMCALEAMEQKNEITAVAHVMKRMVGCIEAQNA